MLGGARRFGIGSCGWGGGEGGGGRGGGGGVGGGEGGGLGGMRFGGGRGSLFLGRGAEERDGEERGGMRDVEKGSLDEGRWVGGGGEVWRAGWLI